MANEYELTIDVEAPPDVVWSVVGDVTAVPRWFTKYVECHVDGDVRTLRSAEGAELVERLLERDDTAMTYAYTVTSGAASLTLGELHRRPPRRTQHDHLAHPRRVPRRVDRHRRPPRPRSTSRTRTPEGPVRGRHRLTPPTPYPA